jgi:hypothetical protein
MFDGSKGISQKDMLESKPVVPGNVTLFGYWDGYRCNYLR